MLNNRVFSSVLLQVVKYLQVVKKSVVIARKAILDPVVISKLLIEDTGFKQKHNFYKIISLYVLSCAAGYYGRPENEGDYCKPCMCSGNIDPSSTESCDSVSGECLRCLNNTSGPACEICAAGYYGDAVSSKNCKSKWFINIF